jgi:hypothetical protein
MNNVIDFFQPQNNDLSVGAFTAGVYLDGQWCDFLIPEKIIFAAEPDFNQAVLNCYPADNELLPEEIVSNLCCGQKIVIKTVYDAGLGQSRPQELPIFAGTIEIVDTEIAGDKQKIEIIAKDFSAKLKRRTVYGRTICSSGNQAIFIAGADTVFNPSSQPNASFQNITQNSRNFKAFASGDNEGRFFSCAEAIYYLLCSYIPAGELVIPTLAQLETLTGGQNIIDVDVTGLNLIDALRRCCKQAGLRFKFVPALSQTGPAEAIVFFKPGNSREVELNCQQTREKINITGTNIAELTGRKKLSPVTNRYIVQGDYKIYEATFDLVKGWDSSLEENDYDKYSPASNENFNQVRDVWRKWVLNEAGDYSQSPYNQGEPFDFSEIFERSPFIQKRRRFLSCLTAGASGTSLGYNLEISYTNGSHWWPYMGSFKVLVDECGIWLSAERFDCDMWFAILKGYLKLRITASVMSDERINFTACDGPVNSTLDVVDRIITLPRRFKYRKVSPQSIFINNTEQNLGIADETDDTPSLVEYTRSLSDSNRSDIEQLRIKTLLPSPLFSPGDRITASPDSRDILGVKYDNNLCLLEKAELDFIAQQSILTIVKRRK